MTIATGTPGAGDPDTDDALAAIAGEQYNIIVMPYNADAEMDKIEAELQTRWGPMSSIDGKAITAFRGTLAAATTYGNARNSLQSVVMPISDSPTSEWEWAAVVAGAVAQSARRDPAQPFQTLPLPGVLAPVTRWDDVERNVLVTDGMALHTVDQGDIVRLERVVTTYQTAPGGIPDRAYMDLNTPLTLSFLRANLRNRIRGKFPRFKLADDGTQVRPRSAGHHAERHARRDYRVVPRHADARARRRLHRVQGGADRRAPSPTTATGSTCRCRPT